MLPPDVTARRGRAAVLAGAAAAALALCACASVPPGRSAVDVVDILGAQEVPAGDTEDKLATTASPKFLGLFRGVVFDYSIFDAAALQRDLARVERYYRGKGFFEAHARTARVIPSGTGHVRVEIVVEEGTPTLNRQVQIDGLETLPSAIAAEVRAAVDSTLTYGTRFDEDAYKSAQTTLVRTLTDEGYAYAKVEVSAQADLMARAVDYTFKVEPGPATKLGTVSIVAVTSDGSAGPLGEIDEKPVRRALRLREGSPFSTSKIESATQALLDLKVFSAVEILPGLSDPPSDVVPLTVKVTPTKLRSVRLGGGVELDLIKTDLHGLVGWEDYNFLGGLRDLSVNFSPGVVIYPVRVNNFFPKSPPPLQGLPEEHLRAELRQNGFIEARTSFFVRPELNVYPLLVPQSGKDLNPDVQVVGYIEPRAAVGVDRRFGRHLSARLAHNVQAEFPFSYYTPKDAQFDKSLPRVLLSYPQLITTLDYRDDQVKPHFGFYLSNDLQVAGAGGNAADIRIAPEVRGYIPLAKSVTFTARASLGFLFASNYGGYVHHLETSDTGPATDSPNLEQYNNDIEIAYFRGFFSGGPGSNRGFPIRGIAPHGPVPFLNPQTQGLLSTCTSGTACAVPIGGFTQWESSVEVRFDVSGPFGAATFCDAGDVSGNQVDIRLSWLHLACGVGVRYATPVGPIRFDVGYRIQPLQVLGYPDEAAVAARYPTFGVQPLTANLPFAWSVGLGEAF